MSPELIERARAGDRAAFAALVQPHRAELQVHCYRMLGSLQDAEDAVQETLLSAWVGLAGYEGRASVRTWLYRIATNRCLNALRAAGRRPVTADPAFAGVPAPSRFGEVLWLQPYPDVLLDGLPDRAPGPEARYETNEAVSLAFVRAVQLLPPNQRAVLLLRDVLGYRAREAAELLDLSENAVNSALARARATLATHHPPTTDRLPRSRGDGERAALERFVEAFTSGDVEALLAALSEDVWLRMPPLPFEYHGVAAARRFFTAIDAHVRNVVRLVPVAANRQPAWGEYARDPASGGLHLAGVLVAAVAGEAISELTHFETAVAPWFGLPRTLA